MRPEHRQSPLKYAYVRSALPRAGVSFEDAVASPEFAAVLRLRLVMDQRQRRRAARYARSNAQHVMEVEK